MLHLIGDVQGCDEALQRLLEVIGFSPSRDRIVVLGDLVNRGPSSLAVLRRMRALGSAATCLLGNHDLAMLAVAAGVRRPHRSDTFDEVLRDAERESWLQWIRRQRLAVLEAGWLCVHAGVLPSWTAAQTLALAGEIEDLLRSAAFDEFLPQMFGSEPVRWDDALMGPPRWRCIINALTRLRFCSADGEMEFETKDGAERAPAGYMPWFDVPGRQTAGQPIACGHWSTLGLVERDDLLAIDTGCVWGGTLTAVRVDGGRREVVQVRCPQQRKPGA